MIRGDRVQDKSAVARERRITGFTLIELLVVIAIISLLVSILLPSLQRANDLAKISVCSTQLHNIHLAIEMYTAEHEDLYPKARQITMSSFFAHSWAGGDFRPLMNPYVANPGVMYCPAGGFVSHIGDVVRGPDDQNVNQQGWNRVPYPFAGFFGVFSYCIFVTDDVYTGYPIWAPSQQSPMLIRRPEDVVNPSVGVVATDQARSNTDAVVGIGIFNHPGPAMDGLLLPPSACIGFNVDYYDGHVTWRTPDEAEPLATWPTEPLTQWFH